MVLENDVVFRNILEKTRELSCKYGVKNMTMKDFCDKLGVSEETLSKYVESKTELIEKALEFERESFKSIFEKYSFEDKNAIDILLVVSKEISQRFKDVDPSVTMELKEYYPAIYHKHFEDKIDFIFEKIKINIYKGISQGVYRDDLSIELVARLYISRLMDLHNPDFFPPEKFCFSTLFEVMFDSFIRSISNQKGIEYYEKQRKSVSYKF